MILSTALSGKNILVTRPAEQAERLSQLIQAAGGAPFVFPAIEIKPPTHSARLEDILSRLDQFDLAIFISPTAVDSVWKRIDKVRSWPRSLRVAAVGQGSARALRERGLDNVIAPTGRSDSEALLALPELQEVTGKRIVIFRGEGGRELLAQALARRGAEVEYAECYRRAKPDTDITPLLQQQKEQNFAAIILTSRESLANLREMLGDAWGSFQAVPVFVSHERIAEAARTLGLNSVEIAPGGDDGLVQAMIKFFQS